MTETEQKLISFVVPCYNSAAYMDICIASLLKAGSDVEILVVDDGSQKDNTFGKAKNWESKFPNLIRAIHQENAGHGGVINTGIKLAAGKYFKVIDSDDWIDPSATDSVMKFLREENDNEVDLLITNYVYEKPSENKRKTMGYRSVFPVGRVFVWDDL